MSLKNKRPGSYGAFLLAVYRFTTEDAIKAEIQRAQNAGTATSAIESVLRRLTSDRFWVRNGDGVKLTEKGLCFLRKRGLIEE